jgi:hypothetical protein
MAKAHMIEGGGINEFGRWRTGKPLAAVRQSRETLFELISGLSLAAAWPTIVLLRPFLGD